MIYKETTTEFQKVKKPLKNHTERKGKEVLQVNQKLQLPNNKDSLNSRDKKMIYKLSTRKDKKL